MFRFTIRDALWLTVVLGMAAAVLFTRLARERDLRQATRRASDQEMEAASARYEAAKGAFDMELRRWFGAGTGLAPSVSDACEAIERFAYATEEMPDPELRVKQLARALDAAQQVLSQQIYEIETEVASPMNPDLYRAKYTRADMEARLRRAEQDLAAARENK